MFPQVPILNLKYIVEIVAHDYQLNQDVDWSSLNSIRVSSRVLDHLMQEKRQMGDEVEIERRTFIILDYDPYSDSYQLMINCPETHRLFMWRLARRVEESLLWRPLVHLELQLTGAVIWPGIDF